MRLFLITFYLLIFSFILVVSEIFVPIVRNLFTGSIFFLVPIIVFSLLGLFLILFVTKENINKVLKKYLILTGVSALSFFISVLLHNLFYSLSIVTGQVVWLSYLMKIFDIGFFFITLFACPIGFLIGTTVSVIIIFRERYLR